MFSYYVMVLMFILQIISFGIILGKFGELRKGSFGIVDFFISALVSILTGLALLWWPNGMI